MGSTVVVNGSDDSEKWRMVMNGVEDGGEKVVMMMMNGEKEQ